MCKGVVAGQEEADTDLVRAHICQFAIYYVSSAQDPMQKHCNFKSQCHGNIPEEIKQPEDLNSSDWRLLE